jgi:hypothetical protein
MALLSGAVNTVATLIFEVNGIGFRNDYPGTSYAITSIFFCNLSSDPTNLTIYLVPQGASPSSSNTIIKALPVSALDTFALDTEKVILDDGDSVWAAATNTNVSVVMSIVRVA